MAYAKHYAVVVGTRPNFVKAAPLVKTLKAHGDIVTLIHTCQHYDYTMSDVFFHELGLPEPDVRLGGDIFAELRAYFAENRFDGTLVFGDVDSTLAGAVAAFTSGQNVFHIEAGLRSFDERMPEERNRKAVDHLSKLHFVTEPSAIENLHNEGIYTDVAVGNLMIESLETFAEEIDKARLDQLPEKFVVLTLHRRENVYNHKRLAQLVELIEKVSERVKIVFPIHPGTEKILSKTGLMGRLHRLIFSGPLSYFEFIKLVKLSGGVITDSGGIQEETTHLGIPCCTLRNNTERPITAMVGSNKLFPEGLEDVDAILNHLSSVFESKPVPMWDDKVSERIYENLCSYTNN